MSRDHEIVRAKKKVSKGCPNTPPKSCSVVTYPQPNAISMHFYRFGFSHMIKLNKSMVMSAGVPWCPRFMSSLPPRDGFWNSPSDHETWCIGCHTRIHVVHLAFTYYVGPSSVMCSELGLALPFPPMRVLEVHGHGLSVSCVKWPLSSSNKVP